jgi:hypothetical protein
MEAIVERIWHVEEAIANAREYLESGKNSDWRRFRPLFAPKMKDGKAMPPHRDWVKNVFLRRWEHALVRQTKLLDRVRSGLTQRRRREDRRAAIPSHRVTQSLPP